MSSGAPDARQALARIKPKKVPADQAIPGTPPRGAKPAVTTKKAPAGAPPAPRRARKWPANRLIGIGMLLSFGMIVGVGVWSAGAMIAGAVIAPAELRVEGERKTVQHLEGGVISEILIEDGDTVQAGDVLMRLDPTSLSSQVEIIDGQLDELMSRRLRLEAEMVDAHDVVMDEAFAARAAARPSAQELFDGQVTLFDARRETLRTRVEQLRGRIEQTGEEISGAKAQIDALDRQLALYDEELEAQRGLLERGLTERSRVIALEREAAGQSGDRGRLLSDVARLKGRISEFEISILEATSQRREEAISTLRDLTARIAELVERRGALQESLERIEIRAPLGGVVLDLAVNTIGGVVTPAEPLLYLVPTERELVVEARIPTADRDRLWPNQPARVLFVGFNQRSTPELDGVVAKIGADKLTDERTGQPYFPVTIKVSDSEFARLRDSVDAELVPGLPAEVHVRTGERSAASYLLKPLTDQLARAFREE